MSKQMLETVEESYEYQIKLHLIEKEDLNEQIKKIKAENKGNF